MMQFDFIHITGMSGSGKSTLVAKLKHPKIAIIDTDEIYYSIISKFLADKSMRKYFESQKMYNKMMKSIYVKIARKIVAEKYLRAKKENKLIVIDGLLNKLYFPKSFFNKKYIAGFFLNTPPDEVYRRRYSRSYTNMCKHCKDVDKLFRTEKNLFRIELQLYLHKINVYMGVADIYLEHKEELKYRKKIGYIIEKNPDNILRTIIGLANEVSEKRQ